MPVQYSRPSCVPSRSVNPPVPLSPHLTATSISASLMCAAVHGRATNQPGSHDVRPQPDSHPLTRRERNRYTDTHTHTPRNPSTDPINISGPDALRPDDIITLYSGRTVEINNPDAEGRLVVSDGVAYASQLLNPTLIVDMCTLTGAQVCTAMQCTPHTHGGSQAAGGGR